MAPPRSVFVVTRRDFTSDSEGRLEILEAYASHDAATEVAESHDEGKVKFEVKELSVIKGAAKGGKGAAASKAKAKKPVVKAKAAEDDEEEDEEDKTRAPAKKAAAAKKTEKKAIPKGKTNSLQDLKMIFTGTFKSMDRKTCEATAKIYGADMVRDKKLAEADLIVVGERPGIKKVEEIKEKSLKTINEAEFLEMVETGKAAAGQAGGDEEDEGEDEGEEEPAPAKKAASKRAAPKPATAAKKSTSTAIEGTPGSLKGLDLLFTGTMTANRPEMEKAAVACGAKIVKKLEDTDYVILGTKPGPKKVEEIEEKKLKTITEAEFFDVIGAEPPSKKQKN